MRYLAPQEFEYTGKRSLVPLAHVLIILVEYEVLIVLVYRIVGQVHAHVVHVVTVRGFVLLGGKSGQPLGSNQIQVPSL
jgi:hypothetical protein